MATANYDLNEIKRRMHGAVQVLKQELGGLRTGRASAGMLDPVQVEAYGTHMPLNQLATISVPEPRMLSVQVWDKSMVHAVEKAIINSNLGLNPATEGQVLRLRIPELNQERRKEMVKVAHKYAEAGRVAVRHVRRDALDLLKKLEKDGKISEDDHSRMSGEVQKATDELVGEGLTSRAVDHIDNAEQQRCQPHHPYLHHVGDGCHTHRKGEQPSGGLCSGHKCPPLPTVDEDATVGAEEQQWCEGEGGGDTQREARASQAEHEPALGNELKPGPRAGDEHCPEVPSIVGQRE